MKREQKRVTYRLQIMLKKKQKKMRKHELHKKEKKKGSELRFAGWVSSFCYISVICYKSRDKRFGLLPRQKEHTDDQLGHIYEIRNTLLKKAQ
jgi:hypothetical protein